MMHLDLISLSQKHTTKKIKSLIQARYTKSHTQQSFPPSFPSIFYVDRKNFAWSGIINPNSYEIPTRESWNKRGGDKDSCRRKKKEAPRERAKASGLCQRPNRVIQQSPSIHPSNHSCLVLIPRSKTAFPPNRYSSCRRRDDPLPTAAGIIVPPHDPLHMPQ